MLERKGDQAKQMSDRAFAELSDMLKQGKSEGLTAYLNAMAKFRSYSLNNIMLLYSQRPDATDVAGFKAWKKRGRHVKKGEKGGLDRGIGHFMLFEVDSKARAPAPLIPKSPQTSSAASDRKSARLPSSRQVE